MIKSPFALKKQRREAEEMMKSPPAGTFNEMNKSCIDCHTTRTPLWRGGPAGPRVYIYYIPSVQFYHRVAIRIVICRGPDFKFLTIGWCPVSLQRMWDQVQENKEAGSLRSGQRKSTEA